MDAKQFPGAGVDTSALAVTMMGLRLEVAADDVAALAHALLDVRGAMNGDDLHEAVAALNHAIAALRRAQGFLREGREHGVVLNLNMVSDDLRTVRSMVLCARAQQ